MTADNPHYRQANWAPGQRLLTALHPVGLIAYERCPLKDTNDCDVGSWMVRSDGYKWRLWCGGGECPFANRSRSDANSA